MKTETKKADGYKVKTVQAITVEQVSGMICGAFEGGSNYWCESAYDWKFKGGERLAGVHLYDQIARGHVVEFKVETDDGEEHTVKPDIEKALQIMADTVPHQFSYLVAENSDASTDDVFFQCLVFGEVIYG
jgi:hypothetical protein